jgi:hypothetical protein
MSGSGSDDASAEIDRRTFDRSLFHLFPTYDESDVLDGINISDPVLSYPTRVVNP